MLGMTLARISVGAGVGRCDVPSQVARLRYKD
jgi:hypothetical protein